MQEHNTLCLKDGGKGKAAAATAAAAAATADTPK
jgi:hypothetical protein